MIGPRTVCLLLFVAVTALPLQARADEPGAGDIEVETRPVSGSDVPQVSVRGIIDAKPAAVWALVLDCENYEKVFSDISAASKLREEGDATFCRETVDMPFPMGDLTAVTRVTTHVDDDRRVRRWELVSGDYDMNSGSWTIEPTDDGKRTIATYTLRADPKMPVPDWLRDQIQEQSLPGVIKDVRRALAPN